MKIIGHIVLWRAERFIRPVLEAAIALCDEVFVAISAAPWRNGKELSSLPSDRTEEWVRLFPVHVVKGSWKRDHDQRNALLAEIRKKDQPQDAFIASIDADEIFDIDQLAGVREAISATYASRTTVCVRQRVYFKHGNWLVVPEESQLPLPVFARLDDSLAFTGSRLTTCGTWTTLDHPLRAHHMNTVGTYEEVVIKSRAGEHAHQISPSWFDTWRDATIDSKNLHQINPPAIPSLRRVRREDLPRHLVAYGDDMILFEGGR